jgi:hypothetical protein
MNTSVVPGYQELFKDRNETYAELVKNLPSEKIIWLCSSLNHELSAPRTSEQNQSHILTAAMSRCTLEDRKRFNSAVSDFSVRTEKPVKILFGTRYFMEMILTELSNYREIPEYKDEAIHDFNFLKAYLLIVDELNLKDHTHMDFSTLEEGDPLNEYRVLWMPIMTQYEYAEKPSVLFEIYRMICLLKFLTLEYRPYLKEYLGTLNLSSPGALVNSFYQIVTNGLQFNDKSLLGKTTHIKVSSSIDQTHLKGLSVKISPNRKGYSLSDIKKTPLSFDPETGYMVMNYNFAMKKMFRGPFFEICHGTSLTEGHDYTTEEKQSIFNTYSQKLSDALEKNYFKPIMQLFERLGADHLHFDDGTKKVPDCYIRIGNKIFLFEYKAYVFPEQLSIRPNFEKIKSYLDERMVATENGKEKGVGQLIRQIEGLMTRDYKFDQAAYTIHNKQALEIYPIIVYNDFNFSLPGINNYLNGIFQEKLETIKAFNVGIAPLLMMNLDTLLDLALTDKKLLDLENLFHEYFRYQHHCKQIFSEQHNQMNFFRMHGSLDEFYQNYVVEATGSDVDLPANLRKLLELSEIAIDELNKPL